MNRHWWTVLHKELRDALRDRRSLRSLAIMTLLYPLLMWSALHNSISKQERSEDKEIRVGVVAAAQAPQLLARLAQAGIVTEDLQTADEAALRRQLVQGRYAAVLQLADDYAQRYAARQPAASESWINGWSRKRSGLPSPIALASSGEATG